MSTGQTVRWSDPNGEPLCGIVVAVEGDHAQVSTPYRQTLDVPLAKLSPMTTNRLVETPRGMRWEA